MSEPLGLCTPLPLYLDYCDSHLRYQQCFFCHPKGVTARSLVLHFCIPDNLTVWLVAHNHRPVRCLRTMLSRWCASCKIPGQQSLWVPFQDTPPHVAQPSAKMICGYLIHWLKAKFWSLCQGSQPSVVMTIPAPSQRKGALTADDVHFAVVWTLSLRFFVLLLYRQHR